jgi:Ni/Fe-hydrogenase 1 B-type cytochrome subunit
MADTIRRVRVWSGWLRVAHAALAVATLALAATGWLIAHAPSVADAASDVHYLAASLLLFGLALRLFLGLVGQGPERFVHLLPSASEMTGLRASVLFYLSLGRAPRPNWYAHNPLWKPFYLLLLIALCVSAATGWLMPDRPLLGGFYLPGVHDDVAGFVTVLVLAHLYSVVLQDIKGQSGDISAMLSGVRHFDVDRQAKATPDPGQVSIRLDDIGRR